jgi:hypothetical protein
VVVVEHHRQARRAVRKWHRKGGARRAFLIWRIGSLASPILPDHGTFFADGQAIKGLSARWFQAKAAMTLLPRLYFGPKIRSSLPVAPMDLP